MKHAHLYKAKVFVYHDDGTFHKMVTYHNVDARQKRNMLNFEKMLRGKFRGLHHVNYYEGMRGAYQYQTRF